MGPAPDRRRHTALALAALCCLAGSATRVTASDGDWRPLQRHAAGSQALLQDASGGAIGITQRSDPCTQNGYRAYSFSTLLLCDAESFFEFEEQMSGAADLTRPRCGLFPDPGPCRAAIPKWCATKESHCVQANASHGLGDVALQRAAHTSTQAQP